MRKLLKNQHGDLNMILSSIVVAITLAISIIVVLNVLGAIDAGDTDGRVAEAMGWTSGTDQYNATLPMTNATTDLQTNIETFYTVAPIVLIVMAAVGILGYVLLLRRR